MLKFGVLSRDPILDCESFNWSEVIEAADNPILDGVPGTSNCWSSAASFRLGEVNIATDGDCMSSCMVLEGIMTGCLNVDCGELEDALSLICESLVMSFRWDSEPAVAGGAYMFEDGVVGMPWSIEDWPKLGLLPAPKLPADDDA